MNALTAYISGTAILVNSIRMELRFDAVADTVKADVYFDSDNPTHRSIFKPYSYQPIKVYYANVLMFTGEVLVHNPVSTASPANLLSIEGCTYAGVVQKNMVNTDTAWLPDAVNGQPFSQALGNLQTFGPSNTPKSPLAVKAGLTLEQIANWACGWKTLGLKVVVDPELYSDSAAAATVRKPYGSMNIEPEQTIFDFLNKLCMEKNLLLSHDNSGNLLITRAKSSLFLTTAATQVLPETNQQALTGPGLQDPSLIGHVTTTTKTARNILWDFANGGWTKMTGNYDAQDIHGIIEVVSQNDSSETLTVVSTLRGNPFGKLNRYGRYKQKYGPDDSADDTARSLANEEVKNCSIDIEIQGWTLGGNLVTPNQLVKVTNPQIMIYDSSIWLIESVVYDKDPEREVAVLTCVLPCCYGDDENDPIVNIFK